MKTRIESTEPIFITDLKLMVQPGIPEWVETDTANRSMCLTQLVRLGKLKVSLGKRCAVSKDPTRVPYRAGRMSRPNKGGMQKPFGNATPPPVQSGMSATEAEALVAKAAAKAAKTAAEQVSAKAEKTAAATAEVAAMKAAMKAATIVAEQVVKQMQAQALVGHDVPNLESQIQRAVELAMSVKGGNISGGRRGPEEPVFIPTGIVQENASELKMSSDTASSDGLDEAAKALKALRKSSKSKK